MSVRFKKTLSLIIFLAIIAFFIYYIRTHWSEFRQLRVVSWWALMGTFILVPLSFYIQGLILKIVVEPFGIYLKFKEYFGLLAITLMGNFLIPFGGLGFRAIYLRKIYKFSYADFITTLIAVWVINFLIYTTGGLVGLLLLRYRANIFDWKLAIIFLIVLVGSVIILLPLRLPRMKNRLVVFINHSLGRWRKLFKKPGLIRNLIYLTVIQFFITTLIFYFCYQVYGFRVNFADTFLPNCLGLYSFFVRLVPGNIGIFELAVVYPSKVLGLTIAQGLSVSAVNRLANIVWTFALGLIFSYILVRPFDKEKSET